MYRNRLCFVIFLIHVADLISVTVAGKGDSTAGKWTGRLTVETKLFKPTGQNRTGADPRNNRRLQDSDTKKNPQKNIKQKSKI